MQVGLYIRDFEVDAEGRGTETESTDTIAIEAATGFPPLAPQQLLQRTGAPCRGTGALSCVFALEPAAGLTGGEVEVRCFVAADLHPAEAAPAKKTSRSLPLCLKMQWQARPSPLGRWLGVPAPVAEIEIGGGGKEELEVRVSWALAEAAAVEEGWVQVQVLMDGDLTFADVPDAMVERRDEEWAVVDGMELLRSAGRDVA